ncbi:MAG: aconitate hydratase [Candidatus Hatepunaea meridiana]|nr:aconitate hydratase [Candidatus Hatepunaea meridiana]
MKQNLVQKILEDHLIDGKCETGEEIGIRIDQTLTQDATGTMAFLQFEAIGIDRVRTKRSVSYIDHNMLQTSFENPDDHRYLQSAAARFGVYFSRPGNGICHQVHLERFAVPGATLTGSDSHTPTAGGMGMIAMGAGGLDVAVAMGGGAYYLKVPKVMRVNLTGQLQPWVAGKDIILEMLRRLTVKGGVGWIVEYGGSGVGTLTVPERATITNMGAELGATTSLFPSDEQTRRFLIAQDRESDWRELKPDGDAEYEETIEIDLSELEPMIAQPSMPDRVVKVSEIEGLPVHQVCVGSCTNSSYMDLTRVAAILKGKTIHPRVSMTLGPGSKQVFQMISQEGTLSDIIAAGARIIESGCGPCIGMGQAPPTGAVTLRTFNRNFAGRTGTSPDRSYLCSPETAAAAALTGEITDPRKLGEYPSVKLPEKFIINDNMIVVPPEDGRDVEIIRGPNIKPVPAKDPLPDVLEGELLLKVEDDITTDHIMPAGAKILPLRSNIPAISEHVFVRVDETFPTRAKAAGGGFIVGGLNYGQGSSREHAALAPMYLGIKAVIVKSFARIHFSNLVNFGIVPLEFADTAGYNKLNQGDNLKITNLLKGLDEGKVILTNETTGSKVDLVTALSARQVEIIKAGGMLAYTKGKNQ